MVSFGAVEGDVPFRVRPVVEYQVVVDKVAVGAFDADGGFSAAVNDVIADDVVVAIHQPDASVVVVNDVVGEEAIADAEVIFVEREGTDAARVPGGDFAGIGYGPGAAGGHPGPSQLEAVDFDVFDVAQVEAGFAGRINDNVLFVVGDEADRRAGCTGGADFDFLIVGSFPHVNDGARRRPVGGGLDAAQGQFWCAGIGVIAGRVIDIH